MAKTIPMSSRLAAEALGTFVLVLGGVGSAILAGEAIGAHGVALAFGLTVLTMAIVLVRDRRSLRSRAGVRTASSIRTN